MKLKIVLLGTDRLEAAISSAADRIVAAINGKRKTQPRKEPATRNNYTDGTHGTRWIMRHYGISQKETTKAAKSLGIVNLGTGNNPRYYEADIKKMAGRIKDIRAIEILEQTKRVKDAAKIK